MNYFNSTIERKRGTCLDCGIDAFVTAGRCDTHYSIHRKKMMLEKQKIKQKVLSLKNTPANIDLAVINNKAEDSALELWFKVKMQLNEPRCAECNAYNIALKQLPNVGKTDAIRRLAKKRWRSCQAHLLPKRHFKSISTHPLNCLVLGSGFSGMCYCHDDYDHDWERASKMKIWPEVVRRFKILYPEIAENEKHFIPQILLDTL